MHQATSHDVADAAAGLVDAVAARRVGHTGDIRFQDAVAVLAAVNVATDGCSTGTAATSPRSSPPHWRSG